MKFLLYLENRNLLKTRKPGTTKATSRRNQLGIIDPLQADGIIRDMTYGKVETPTAPAQPNGGVTVTQAQV